MRERNPRGKLSRLTIFAIIITLAAGCASGAKRRRQQRSTIAAPENWTGWSSTDKIAYIISRQKACEEYGDIYVHTKTKIMPDSADDIRAKLICTHHDSLVIMDGRISTEIKVTDGQVNYFMISVGSTILLICYGPKFEMGDIFGKTPHHIFGAEHDVSASDLTMVNISITSKPAEQLENAALDIIMQKYTTGQITLQSIQDLINARSKLPACDTKFMLLLKGNMWPPEY